MINISNFKYYFLALLCLLIVTPKQAFAQAGTVITVSNEQELRNAVGTAQAGATIHISNSFSVQGELRVRTSNITIENAPNVMRSLITFTQSSPYAERSNNLRLEGSNITLRGFDLRLSILDIRGGIEWRGNAALGVGYITLEDMKVTCARLTMYSGDNTLRNSRIIFNPPSTYGVPINAEVASSNNIIDKSYLSTTRGTVLTLSGGRNQITKNVLASSSGSTDSSCLPTPVVTIDGGSRANTFSENIIYGGSDSGINTITGPDPNNCVVLRQSGIAIRGWDIEGNTITKTLITRVGPKSIDVFLNSKLFFDNSASLFTGRLLTSYVNQDTPLNQSEVETLTRSLYRDALRREPSESEVQGWYTWYRTQSQPNPSRFQPRLTQSQPRPNKDITKDMILYFFTGPESVATNGANSNTYGLTQIKDHLHYVLLHDLYAEILNRPADSPGLSYWLLTLASNPSLTRDQLRPFFVNSQQYTDMLNADTDVIADLTRFYKQLRGQEPPASVVSGWREGLTSRIRTRSDIEIALINGRV